MSRLKWSRFAQSKEDPLLPEILGDDEDPIPPIESRLRHNILRMPKVIQEASGIVVYGRRIKSLLYSTDIAIIKNCDADAIFCVYPFTAQRTISSSVIRVASMPVFCGVGGGITQGSRAVYLAMDAENQGAMGVVLNAPFPNRDLRTVARIIDIPIVVTVASESVDVGKRIEHGASIINVAGGANTAQIVRSIREKHPRVPIIASGGRTDDTIRATIEAGANAIVYAPPSARELYRDVMDGYRAT